MRPMVGTIFRRRWVEKLEPRIRELTRALLAEVQDQATFDFAAVLSREVVCELVGIPATDRAQPRADNDLLNHCEDGSAECSAESLATELHLMLFYADLICERATRHPCHDRTSHTMAGRVNNRPPTDAQMLAFVFLMVSVANKSIGTLLGLVWHYDALFPDVQRADIYGRVADWTDESLRCDSPTEMVGRTLKGATWMHGTEVPEGTRIALVPGWSNRDPAAFPVPDGFDLNRVRSHMLSSARGPHLCIGSSLPRWRSPLRWRNSARWCPTTKWT